MSWIRAEGSLENVCLVATVAGVEFVGRVAKPVGGDRYIVSARVDDTAIPAIEALGCVVTVIHTEDQLEELAEAQRAARDAARG